MIWLIIGPSCAGKTQFVTNSFIGNSKLVCTKDIIKVTESDTSYLIGDWTLNAKVRGTDKIARQHLKLIAPQIEKLMSKGDKDIVAEGVNICWSFVLDNLIQYADQIKLIYVQCSLGASIYRNQKLGGTQRERNIKATWTRTNNTFLKYNKFFDSYVVNTEFGIDFRTFSKDTAILKKYTDEQISILAR